jgi:hypothetical protein
VTDAPKDDVILNAKRRKLLDGEDNDDKVDDDTDKDEDDKDKDMDEDDKDKDMDEDDKNKDMDEDDKNKDEDDKDENDKDKDEDDTNTAAKEATKITTPSKSETVTARTSSWGRPIGSETKKGCSPPLIFSVHESFSILINFFVCFCIDHKSPTSKSPLSAKSPMSADGDVKYPGLNDADKLEITGRIIHATWDIAPSADGETPCPFLYWKTDTEWACASALIKRRVIVFISYFMYVLCPILLSTNIKWDMNTMTYLLISALAYPILFCSVVFLVPFKCVILKLLFFLIFKLLFIFNLKLLFFLQSN